MYTAGYFPHAELFENIKLIWISRIWLLSHKYLDLGIDKNYNGNFIVVRNKGNTNISDAIFSDDTYEFRSTYNRTIIYASMEPQYTAMQSQCSVHNVRIISDRLIITN
jgi:hypothetical protein